MSNDYLNLLHFKQFVFPANYYNKNPIEAITSVVGTNAEIISINKHKSILPNNRILVDVKYKSIDFDTFTIYLCDNPKLISIGSNFMISDNNTDISTGEIVKVPIKIFKPVVSSLNNDIKKCFIRINTLVENKETKNLHYYGIQIKDPHEIFHDYCSMFRFDKDPEALLNLRRESEIIKYVTKFDQTETFKNILNEIDLDDVDIKQQINYYEDLTTVVSLDHNSRKDIEYFKLKLQPYSFYKLAPDSLIKHYHSIAENKNVACHLDFRNITPIMLKNLLLKLKTGIVILMKKRHYTSLIYINDDTKKINVDEVYSIIEKDLNNLLNINKYLVSNNLGKIVGVKVNQQEQEKVIQESLEPKEQKKTKLKAKK